jgi:hypothetical protein
VISASVVLVLLLAVFAGVAVSDRDEERDPPPPVREPAAAAPEPARLPPERQLVLVRRRDGLPSSWIRRLRRSPAVDALAKASRTQWLLRRSATAGGAVVDAAPAGYAVPLDVHVVDPRAYARVTGEPAFRRVRRGRVLLSATSARQRRLGRGGRMTLAGGRTVRVAGVVADRLAREAEVVAATADVPRADRRQTAVIVATRNPAAVARAVPNDPLTRVATLDTRPAGRRGIIRPAAVKRRFGEFAVRLPYGRDWIGIDPRWLRRNVVSRDVPILGAVTCNRSFIAPLRRALGRLERRGLARLVDPGDYAGCYAPRSIPASGSLSLHAWGLAIDLNASENQQGSEPRQDRRLVRAFEREGFTWGGRWPTAPDGMHFELHGDAGR